MTGVEMGRMRHSKVLEKLRSNQVALCFKLNLDSARAAEFAAMSGFDCIWTCNEHIATDWSLIERQIYAAKAWDKDVLVRVSRGCYSDYIRPLEMDATGLMVPHIMSLEDAKSIVKMTRFHPIGLRPIDGGNADGQYCMVDFQNYIKEANKNRFVAVQIEDVEPLDDLEAIASLEGIDIIFFGPSDFTQSIGAPGDFNHPLVKETRIRVAEVCKKYGKFAGTPGNTENIDELVEMGYRFINVGADVIGLQEYFTKITKGCAKYL